MPTGLPSVSALETFQPLIGTKIYDDNDELVTELHVERRMFVPLARIPQSLRDAVIATEDRRFYHHWGVDPIGIARAIYQNYRRGRIVEGGSTITQQLVKMRYVGDDRTYTRKLREAFTALWLERHLGKQEILRRYLNSVYLGNGAYGMSAAARLYFGKGLSELTLPEAAMLAGMIRAPSRDNPLQNLEGAQARAADADSRPGSQRSHRRSSPPPVPTPRWRRLAGASE